MQIIVLLFSIIFLGGFACNKHPSEASKSPSSEAATPSNPTRMLEEQPSASDLTIGSGRAEKSSARLNAFLFLESHGEQSEKYIKVACEHEPEDAMSRKVDIHFYSHPFPGGEQVDLIAEQELRVSDVIFNLTGIVNVLPGVGSVVVTCRFKDSNESLEAKIERYDHAKPSSSFQLNSTEDSNGKKIAQGIDILTDDADIPYNLYHGHGLRRLQLREGDIHTNYIVPNWSEGSHDMFTLVRLGHIYKEDTPSEKLSMATLCQAGELQIVPTNWDSLGKNLGPDYESTAYNTMKMSNDSPRVQYFKAQCAKNLGKKE